MAGQEKREEVVMVVGLNIALVIVERNKCCVVNMPLSYRDGWSGTSYIYYD